MRSCIKLYEDIRFALSGFYKNNKLVFDFTNKQVNMYKKKYFRVQYQQIFPRFYSLSYISIIQITIQSKRILIRQP